MQLKIPFFFPSLGLSQKCNGIWVLFSKTCNCPDDKAGRCGKRHNGRNVFHFSPVFPKMCWQPRMIFESLSKECFSSLIKGSFIRILFLIPRSKRGHALNILRSSAGLKWKCWSQHMCCYFFWLNNLKRKIKKIVIKSAKGLSFAWSSVTWNSRMAVKWSARPLLGFSTWPLPSTWLPDICWSSSTCKAMTLLEVLGECWNPALFRWTSQISQYFKSLLTSADRRTSQHCSTGQEQAQKY